MAAAVFCGRLVQNYVLLHYEEGVRELAVFALALAFIGVFQSTLAFAPQMANVLVRGPKSFRSSFRFLIGTSVVFTVPIVLVAWTPLGARIMPVVYRVSDDDIRLILLYLRYFAPLVLLGGVSLFFEGLLVQARRTGIVSTLRMGNLGVLIGMLLAGSRAGWSPVLTLSLSLVVPLVCHTVATGMLALRFHVRHSGAEDRLLTVREIASFFLPMVATTIMFTLTRPIIFGFLTASAGTGEGGAGRAEAMIAGLSLAFNFNMLFQATVNQFRNLSVTFGTRDLPGLRRFMKRVTIVVALAMAVSVASPLARLFMRYLQGASGAALDVACQALWPLIAVPVVIAFRNYYHGLAMVRRRTVAMAAGGVARNLVIVLCGPVLLALGWYNHVAAAAMLVTGFVAEAATVFRLARSNRGG